MRLCSEEFREWEKHQHDSCDGKVESNFRSEWRGLQFIYDLIEVRISALWKESPLHCSREF